MYNLSYHYHNLKTTGLSHLLVYRKYGGLYKLKLFHKKPQHEIESCSQKGCEWTLSLGITLIFYDSGVSESIEEKLKCFGKWPCIRRFDKMDFMHLV